MVVAALGSLGLLFKWYYGIFEKVEVCVIRKVVQVAVVCNHLTFDFRILQVTEAVDGEHESRSDDDSYQVVMHRKDGFTLKLLKYTILLASAYAIIWV